MNTSPPEIMTIEDVAEFLRLPLSSAYKLAHAGKIPGQKVGRHWRFHRQTLVDWVAGRSVPLKENRGSGPENMTDTQNSSINIR